MSTIGVDCEVIVDNTGYFVLPGSYLLHQPRIRKATIRADGNEGYVDLGPGKRVWKMTILCLNDLLKYDGTPTGMTGEDYRQALFASYTGSTGLTIVYFDPISANRTVHFDDYIEHVHDMHSQVVELATGGGLGASYLIPITLVEA